MKLALKNSKSGLILTGKVPLSAHFANLSELLYRGEITSFNEVNGRYEIAGLSLRGRPAIKEDIVCAGCQNIWKNCNHCYKADREKQWIVLPDGIQVKYAL